MNRSETEKLTQSIDALIETCHKLRREQFLLQKRYGQLEEERNELLRRNDVARHKIENMLQQLQSLEVRP